MSIKGAILTAAGATLFLLSLPATASADSADSMSSAPALSAPAGAVEDDWPWDGPQPNSDDWPWDAPQANGDDWPWDGPAPNGDDWPWDGPSPNSDDWPWDRP
ncbi:MAG TPA: hypothetical protein VFV67_15095 [Actinophytocola sp.]|uniref:hypothetical protein n=1 Tax=Actinophytocola sp. TaxID=1872138 RepID=UPI002DB6197D|nr:hypothetical protein [Actinophytocola sp.]HEU5471976.1 hypothetical protein [Actinophytocola sp.]